jgi:hypothetical protein
MIAEHIPGYTYGAPEMPRSPVSLSELEDLKKTVGFTDEDQRNLRLAGEVLADQAKQLVEHWRGIVAKTPHLARHSHTSDGKPIPRYAENSGLRFQQWVLDTCFRSYDQDWLNYAQEIALRHTPLKKNKTDGVESTSYVPLRDYLAFIAVINETTKPYLAAKGHTAADVEKMHGAWCKSLSIQAALWARPYTDTKQAPDKW